MLDVSPVGNLTIVFSKPILIPPIQVDFVDNSTSSRQLAHREYEIQEVIDIYVESDFHESESEAIGIEGYSLTRLT